MYLPARKFALLLGAFIIFASATSAYSQEVFASSEYKLDLTGATEAPKLRGLPRIGFPQEAIKKGVEGTLIVEMTLTETGKVSGIVFLETLPDGYEQAVRDAFETLNFMPATRSGVPVPVKLRLEYTVTMVFSDRDKNVNKPEITEKPDAVYPESELADGRKGEVTVGILFYKDGTLKVQSVGSTMPKPFDEAAIEAANKIKFTPGSHKKNEGPVSVKMDVVYKFKP